MQDVTFAVQGAWYSYGDSVGDDGTSASGDCPSAGHATSECSIIQAPPASEFSNANGAMRTSGSAEPVLDVVGKVGTLDFENMWGAGIACDLNSTSTADAGTAMKLPYDAPMHGVIGIAFDLDTPDHTLPTTGLRVEFPTPNNKSAAHVWQPGTSANNYVSPIRIGSNKILFATDVMQPAYVAAVDRVTFDATQILSVQWHVPTKALKGQSYDFTISNFALLTSP